MHLPSFILSFELSLSLCGSLCIPSHPQPLRGPPDLFRALCKPAGGGEGISCLHRRSPLPSYLSSPTAHLCLLSAPFLATPALGWVLPAPPAPFCIWSCRKPRATLPASSVTDSGSRAGGRRRQHRAYGRREQVAGAGFASPKPGPGLYSRSGWSAEGGRRGGENGGGLAWTPGTPRPALASCAPLVGWEIARTRGRKAKRTQGSEATQMGGQGK